MSRRALVCGAFASIALIVLTGPVSATELRVSEQPDVLFEDQRGRLVVELVDPSEQVEGLTLKGDPKLKLRGPLNGGKQTNVVNGKMFVTYVFYWEVTPPRERGRYPLGPVTLQLASGKAQTAAVRPVQVVRRAKPGGRLIVEPERTSGPVGHPVRVVYTLLTARPRYQGGFMDSVPFGLTALEVAPLSAKLKLQAVAADPDSESSRLTLQGKHELVVQDGLMERDGFGYYATRFALLIKPNAPGALDLSSGARLLVKGGTRRVRTLFGPREEAERVEVVVKSGAVSYTAEPLPSAGRPPGFSGAVGRFQIEASCAVREANAFDPIEVTITVRAEAALALEDLVLPDWGAVPEIDAAFQVAKDVDPGKLAEDGSKTFSKVFRARSSDVAALPALPFPYYDAEQRAYRVALSKPIPLAIAAVKTVDADDALGGGGTQRGTVGSDQPQALTSLVGIGANYTDMSDAVPVFEGVVRIDLWLLLATCVPPLLLLGAVAQRWLRARGSRGPKPLSRALAALGKAKDVASVRTALQVYFQERLELEGGELTPAELEQALRARVVPAETVERAVTLWEALDRARFAGGETPAGAEDLVREVDPCV